MPKKLTKKEKSIQTKERRLKKKERELEFRSTFNATIIGALTFVAGLFWRDAITSVLELLPSMQGIIGNIISAILVTGVFVYIILKMNSEVKEQKDKVDEAKKKLDEEKASLGMQ